jgi:hypothetical protein
MPSRLGSRGGPHPYDSVNSAVHMVKLHPRTWHPTCCPVSPPSRTRGLLKTAGGTVDSGRDPAASGQRVRAQRGPQIRSGGKPVKRPPLADPSSADTWPATGRARAHPVCALPDRFGAKRAVRRTRHKPRRPRNPQPPAPQIRRQLAGAAHRRGARQPPTGRVPTEGDRSGR